MQLTKGKIVVICFLLLQYNTALKILKNKKIKSNLDNVAKLAPQE